jgi:cell division protein FtsI (penicillin-binding protein 3)
MNVLLKSAVRKRLIFIKLIFLAAMVFFSARLVWLQIIDRSKFLAAANNQQNLIITIQAKRGTIYDRNMRVLAQDIDSYSFYVVPENIKDKAGAARKLSRITGQGRWLSKFKRHPRFLYVARKTSSRLEARLRNSGIETLHHFIEPKRVYPSGDLALALLGRVDIDNKGLSGLELQFDDYLSGRDGKAILKRDGLGHCYLFDEQPIITPEAGEDIICTIDLNLQQIAEQELIGAMKETDAKHGMGLFVKAGTGEILACANFDTLGRQSTRNMAITDQYEPGSTFKIITMALALGSGRFELSDIINVEHGRFRIGRRTIRDDHEYDTLSVEDVLVYSSNIGASKLALAMGDERVYKAIKEAGFVSRLGVDFPSEADGAILEPKWRDHYLANISFGHGISASPMQIVALYDAIATDGYLSRPYLGEEKIGYDGTHCTLNNNYRIRQVFPADLTHILKSLLCEVVQRGTATKANSEIVQIAGKTGTALKLREDGRGYDHRKARASFVGFFPADNPMAVGIILLDEPKNSRYGGETAAPVLRNIAERYYVLPEQMRERYVERMPHQEELMKFAASNPEHEMGRMLQMTSGYYESSAAANTIPNFKGLTVKQALTLAAAKGYECQIEGSGIVKNQSPDPGIEYEEGIIIKLRCATG